MLRMILYFFAAILMLAVSSCTDLAEEVSGAKPRALGNEFDAYQAPECWTWLGYGLPLETPVTNLYNVGDGCIAPGLMGSTGSVESGYRAASVIEKILTKSEK